MLYKLVCAGSLALLMSTVGALACKGPEILYDDTFDSQDSSWGQYDGMEFKDGALTVKPAAGGNYRLQNEASLYDDFDVCVDLVQKNPDPANAFGGIIFWAADYENYYVFVVAANGYVELLRLQRNKWLTPLPWTKLEDTIKPGAEVNQLRVVAKGRDVTLFVNDKEVRKIKGQPPQGGSKLGLYSELTNKIEGEFVYDNFVVTNVP